MVRIFCLILVLLYIYIYIYSTNIPPIMFINRIYEHQILLSLKLVSFLVRLRTYQHPCRIIKLSIFVEVQCKTWWPFPKNSHVRVLCDEKFTLSGSESERKERWNLADAVSLLNGFMNHSQKMIHYLAESHHLVKRENLFNIKKVQTC
jgi:hypothetical protein